MELLPRWGLRSYLVVLLGQLLNYGRVIIVSVELPSDPGRLPWGLADYLRFFLQLDCCDEAISVITVLFYLQRLALVRGRDFRWEETFLVFAAGLVMFLLVLAGFIDLLLDFFDD